MYIEAITREGAMREFAESWADYTDVREGEGRTQGFPPTFSIVIWYVASVAGNFYIQQRKF